MAKSYQLPREPTQEDEAQTNERIEEEAEEINQESEVSQDEVEQGNQEQFIEKINEDVRHSSSEDSSGEPSIFSRNEEESKSTEEEMLEAKSSSASIQTKSKEHIICFRCNEKGHYKDKYSLTKI